MIKPSLFILSLLLSKTSFSSEHQMIDTLGASPKGQYVALEEYGYKAQTHSYYVKIKFMNVWKQSYVGSPIEVEVPASRRSFLEEARSKARILAKDQLSSFGISG